MKKVILFDMDGTIADTSSGIINSHKYAHEMMGVNPPEDNVLYSIIGGPLLQTYKTTFKFSDKDAVMAVNYYRKYYASEGFRQAKLYNGMKNFLEMLHEKKFLIGLATLKASIFISDMLSDMEICSYFDTIHSMDRSDTLSKSDIIKMCLADLDIEPNNSVMVGDSIHDLNGAREAGIDFIGVTYGFGFRKGESEDDYSEDFVMCDSVQELCKLF